MTHVVERCPSCGVEHDVSADSLCEACDTPLRAWCRTHSREFGWLDGPSCPRCAAAAAPAPHPRPVLGPRPEPLFIPDAPGGPLRDILGDAPESPAATERVTVQAVLVGVGLAVLTAIGGLGLVLSLVGLISLLNSEIEARDNLVPALTFIFAGSLLALAVVAHARKRAGPRDPPEGA